MFGTEATVKKINPRFYVGINECKVEKIEVKKSSTPRVRLIFNLYGPKVTQEDFKPWNKPDGTPYEGQVGSAVTNWFDPSVKEEVGKVWTRCIFPMLKCYGVYELYAQRVNENTTLEETVEILNEILTGNELSFIYINFGGEEYERPGKDYPGYNLFFRGFAVDTEGKAKLTAGTMKKLASKEEVNSSATTDDMPF